MRRLKNQFDLSKWVSINLRKAQPIFIALLLLLIYWCIIFIFADRQNKSFEDKPSLFSSSCCMT